MVKDHLRNGTKPGATVMLLLSTGVFVRAQMIYGNAIIKYGRGITLQDKWISIVLKITLEPKGFVR